MQSIGCRIRQIREQKGISQVVFAKALNTSQTTIVKWECDKSQPSIQAVLRICKFGGVTCDWLLTGNGLPYEKEYELNVNDLTTEDMELITKLKKLPLTKHLVVKYVTNAVQTREAVEELKKYIQNPPHGSAHSGGALSPAGV